MNVDYFSLIQKYIPADTITYTLYVPHVVLVTAKAIQIAQRLELSDEQKQFIEEAGMLHDIGICKVHDEFLGCTGDLPYLHHMPEGAKILQAEGLPRHARVAETHIGVGLTKEEIVTNRLGLPERDMIPETIEEKIISFADLFFSKNAKMLFCERTVDEARVTIGKFGEEKVKIFEEWRVLFER